MVAPYHQGYVVDASVLIKWGSSRLRVGNFGSF